MKEWRLSKMSNQKISYVKDDQQVKNITVNGVSIPDTTIGNFSKAVAEEIARQEKEKNG